jgi:hypothetical protein
MDTAGLPLGSGSWLGGSGSPSGRACFLHGGIESFFSQEEYQVVAVKLCGQDKGG